MNTLDASIFSQKGTFDFHVTTVAIDLCMKEVIDTS